MRAAFVSGSPCDRSRVISSMTANRWARRSRGASRPMTARLLEKNRGPTADGRPAARVRRCAPLAPWRIRAASSGGRAAAATASRGGRRSRSRAPARLRTPLAVQPRRPGRLVGRLPLVERLAKHMRLSRQRRNPLAVLHPTNQGQLLIRSITVTSQSSQSSSVGALSPKSLLSHFRGPLHSANSG